MATTRDDIQDGTGQRTFMAGRGFFRGYGHGPQYANLSRTIGGVLGNPIQGEPGYATAATFQNDLSTVVGTIFWINEGNQAAAVWVNIDQALVIGALGVIGVGANYKIARGVTALDGSNPTPVVTGLTTVVSATVSLEGTAAPGLGTSVLTVASTNYATGALAVYAWKVTGAGDATLIASTGTENFEWIAVGN